MWGMELSLLGGEFSRVIGTGIQEEIEDSDWPVMRGWAEGVIIGSLGGWLKWLGGSAQNGRKTQGWNQRHLGKERSIIKDPSKEKRFLSCWHGGWMAIVMLDTGVCMWWWWSRWVEENQIRIPLALAL